VINKPPTPSPKLNHFLEVTAASIQASLGAPFSGAYVQGRLPLVISMPTVPSISSR
jgi:hypothetical protein